MGSTGKKILIAIIILVSIGFIVIPEILEEETEETTEAASNGQNSDKLPIEVFIVKDVSLEDNLTSTGSLHANESVTLQSEVSGIVENIYFKEGQKVKKGQLLIRLRDDEIRAEITKLQHTRKLNEAMEARQKQLLAKEAISQEEYETALTTLNTIIAEIQLKQVQLDKRRIRAPFTGIIGLRKISEGSYITPSETIASLYSLNPIKIDFAVPGKYASEVNEGDKITFTVDGIDDVFEGKIYAVEPQVDPQTRTLQLRAQSNNENAQLLPGQFAKIELTLDTYENTIMIPSEAVIPEMNGMKVFIYENGKAVTKQIETGIRTADKIQVKEGLNTGDTVITSGTLQLRPGMDVRIK